MSSEPWENDPIVEVKSWENDPTVEETPWEADKTVAQANQDNLGMMPFVNQKIADMITFFPEMGAEAVSLIPGVDVGGVPRKYIEKGFEAIGAPTAGRERKPESLSEHVGTGVGEVAQTMLPIGWGIKTMAKGAGLASKVAKTVYDAMVKHPIVSAVSEVTAGMGMGAGREVGEENYPDSPIKRSVAETVGGVAGGLAPSVAAYAPTAALIRSGKTILRKISLPFTEKGAMYRAGQYIKGQVPDPTKTAGAMSEETISQMPKAVQAGEKRLTQLYKNLISKDPVTEADSIEQISKAIATLEGAMQKLGYGSPELLAEITQKRVASIELGMDKRVMSAMEKANKKLNAIPVAKRRSVEARVVRGEIEKVMYAERAKDSALWAEVPKDIKVGTEKTVNTAKQLIADTPQAQKVDIPFPLKKSSILKGKKKGKQQAGFVQEVAVDEPVTGVSTIKEMQGLRSKLLEVSRIARKNGQWNKARIANDVSDAILEDIENSAKGAGSEKLQAALASTKKFKKRFESGTLGKLLGYDRTGAPRISPELTLEASVGRMGQKGAVDIDKITPTSEAKQAVEKYLGRSYTKYATDPKTGKIIQHKSDDFISNNEEILDQFPELRNKMTDAAGAQNLADDTFLKMQARKKRLKDPNISESAKFLKSADIGTEVESVFKSRNPIKTMQELVKQAGKDKTGKALEGLRGGFVDYMLEKSHIGAYNDIGEKTLSGSTLLNMVKKHKPILLQLFGQNKVSRMEVIGKELTKVEKFSKTKAGKVDIELKDFASSALRLFSKVGGARLGGWMGKESAGGSLQMAQIYSSAAGKFVKNLTKDRAEQMIHDAITGADPKLLQALLLPIDKPTSKQGQKNLKILGERMNLWLIGSGKRIMDDIATDEGNK